MKIVVLTGAGISAESGIETFRSQDGLWCNHNVEDVASFEGFKRNPTLVHQFYNQRRRELLSPEIKPNQAHKALTRIEKKLSDIGGEFLLISQNIDNLHHRAGSKNLICMHGELLKVRCTNCHQVFEWFDDCDEKSQCSNCQKTTLRPHIVWFGEMPLGLNECYRAVEKCHIFAAIGTSGQVYPAAGFANLARQNGADCIEINLEQTSQKNINPFSQHYIGKASKEVPKWVDSVIAKLY